MALLNIYKASAGSGKTFQLTGEYLKLIFNPERNFRSILAVTFTNKATAEMRERILHELYILSTGMATDHATNLKKEFNLSDIELKNRAKFLLRQILHNYSRFNISTIDSFFQKILKAFTRETGLGAGYNIELNIKTILEQSIGQFFENTDTNKTIKEWLSNYAIQKIEDGKSWDIEKDIYDFSLDAFNEVFFGFTEEQLAEFSKIETFRSYKKQLSSVIYLFTDTSRKFGTQATDHIKKHRLEVSDFSNGMSGVAGYLTKLQNVNQFNIKEPGVRVLKALNSSDGIEDWCTKTSKKKTEIQQCVNGGLNTILKDAIDFYNAQIETFNTARAIYNGIDVFAVIVEVFNQMNTYCREKNIFLLSMASPLLSKMIGSTDAPFIYEKTGEYLNYFMIDEFQDTSKIQWDNFSPLFLNGISQENQSLVVGDVKQSIYRWRNGDWTLLNHRLANDFKTFGVDEQNLEYNWRSTPEIVNFNNWVFNNISIHAIAYMQGKEAPEDLTQDYFDIISHIYKSASQQIPDKNKDLSGSVQVKFCDEGKDKEENTQWYLDEMTLTLIDLLDKGVQPKDIAIIVRRWKEGAMIAKHLMEYIKLHPERSEQFCFVSNDSVLLGSSSIILLLIALLEYIVNENNKESKASIIFFFSLLSTKANEAAEELVNINLDEPSQFYSKLPPSFKNIISTLRKQPLPNLINQLLNVFIYQTQTVAISKQLPFIHSFQDIILNFSKNNGNDISGFLNWWKEFGVTTPINLSEDQNAIRIITIHKSKGLEYKAVLIPFANWGLDQLSKYMWCATPEAFNQFSTIPIKYSSSLAKTSFKKEYWHEKSMALIDNLNLLYVAFTRAVQSLHIFAPKPSKEGEYTKISDLIFHMFSISPSLPGNWDSDKLHYTHGKIILPERNDRIEPNAPIIIRKTINSSLNLKVKLSGNEFFRDENGQLQKKINKGNIYHKIMERIQSIDDIETAVYSMQNEGYLSNDEAAKFIILLKGTLTGVKVKNWFDNTYKILNESSIILQRGETKRPDRVMIGKDEIIVIDYKFTSNKSKNHLQQVESYMNHIYAIEKKNITGYVWYLLENHLEMVPFTSK